MTPSRLKELLAQAWLMGWRAAQLTQRENLLALGVEDKNEEALLAAEALLSEQARKRGAATCR